MLSLDATTGFGLYSMYTQTPTHNSHRFVFALVDIVVVVYCKNDAIEYSLPIKRLQKQNRTNKSFA